MKKDKTVEMVTPMCSHGNARAVISDGDESFVTDVRQTVDGEPIQPGETMMTVESIEGEPRKYRVTGEYTRPGPSRAATRQYRKGYDKLNWN